jgi:hypothetical protein
MTCRGAELDADWEAALGVARSHPGNTASTTLDHKITHGLELDTGSPDAD